MSENPDLEAEADRLLKEAGVLNIEHGILPHPDNRGTRHEWRVSEDELERLASLPTDRRSTKGRRADGG